MSSVLDLIQTKVNYVVQGGHRVVIKDIFRKLPTSGHCSCLSGAAVLGQVVGRRSTGSTSSSSSLLLWRPQA